MKTIIIVIFVISLSYTSAQNESGSRFLDDSAFKSAGYWFDNSDSMLQISYPIIKSIPPISTGMPYDILLSYIYLDSLLRFTNNYQQDSLIHSWQTKNDTLVNAIKFLYKSVDYNPIIYNQYIGEVALNNISVSGGRYASSLFYLRNALLEKLKVHPINSYLFL